MSTATATILPTLADYLSESDRHREVLEARFAHIDPPTDATRVYPWSENRDGTVDRTFVGTERTVTPTITVAIWGTQNSDGRIADRHAHIYVAETGFDPGVLDAPGLHRLADAITAAAAELDAAC